MQETWLDLWVRKIPSRTEQLPILVFLSEEFHGQRILAHYSLWGHRDLDTTEQLTLSLFFKRVQEDLRIQDYLVHNISGSYFFPSGS